MGTGTLPEPSAQQAEPPRQVRPGTPSNKQAVCGRCPSPRASPRSPPPAPLARASRALGKEKAERATHPQLPAADFHVALLDYVVKVGGHASALGFGESRAAVRRWVRAGPASSQQPPGARRRLVPPSSRRWGQGVGSRAVTGRDTAWRSKLRPPSACRSPPSPPPPLQLPRAGPSLGGAQPAAAHHLGSPAQRGREGAGGGLICRCRSFLPPPTAGGAAGLGDARQTRLITASPSSAPRLPPGSPAHSAPSAAPSAGFLRTSSSFWGSGSPLLSGSWERAGCWDASKERGNRERDNCVLQGPCLQCIFIPGHGLALQVFAPLGSMDRRQALPGAHKETNRAHVSNPYAAGDAKRSGEAACRLHPSQQAARARVNGFMHAFRLTTTESGSWLSIFWGKMGTVAVTRGCK